MDAILNIENEVVSGNDDITDAHGPDTTKNVPTNAVMNKRIANDDDTMETKRVLRNGEEDKIQAASPVSRRKTTVFFSYSNKDRDWVEDVVERLESGGEITCMYDERDFLAGVPIMDNILSCIRKSDRTVLVLSPDFLKSPWCGYEAQLTLSEHLMREQKVVIPVLLRGDVIPDFISHLTYLDVSEARFWEKFLALLISDNPECTGSDMSVQRYFIGREEDQFNGKKLLTIGSRGYCCWERFDFDGIFESLNSKGLQIDLEAVEKVKTAMRESGFIRCLCCIRCYMNYTTLICVFGPLTIISILAVLSLASRFLNDNNIPQTNTNEEYLLYRVLGCECIAIVLFWIIAIGCFLQVSAVRDAAIRVANSVLLDYDVILGTRIRNFVTGNRELIFVYFKSKQCLSHLEKYLIRKGRENKTVNCLNNCMKSKPEGIPEEMETLTSESDLDSNIVKQAKRYLSEAAYSYVYLQYREKLKNPTTGQRHAPQGPCLCQLAEERLQLIVNNMYPLCTVK